MTVASGEVLAVMGPSGAGKTTLLKMLTNEKVMGPSTAELASGEVTLNGHLLSPAVFRDQCAYIEQKDIGLFTFMSCADHVAYAVTLFRGGCSSNELDAITTSLLAATGLASCQHVRAGDVESPGLSGGQRRRLSLAVALAKNPALLVADEPTSGLDDAAATAVMELLRELAKQSARLAVVCTIHQPGARVYAGMDQLLLLSKGCTAYYGPASALSEHLASLGKPVPLGVSVSEHALELINADFASESGVDEIIDAWRKRTPPPDAPALSALPPVEPRASAGRQVWTLLRKFGGLNARDTRYFWTRFLSCFALSTVYGLIYIDARKREQVDVIYIFNSVYLLMSNIIFTMLPTMLFHFGRLPTVQREIKAGMYSPVAYWLVVTLLVIPTTFFVSIGSIAPWYVILDFPFSSWFETWALYTATALFFDAMMEAASFDSREVAIFSSGFINLMALFSTGFFLDAESILWPLRAFYYILPAHWMFGGIVSLLFREGKDFSGATLVNATPTPKDFVCEEAEATTACYGVTGVDILYSLKDKYDVVEPDVQFGVHLGWICLMFVVIRLLVLLRLILRMQLARAPQRAGQLAVAADETTALLPDEKMGAQ